MEVEEQIRRVCFYVQYNMSKLKKSTNAGMYMCGVGHVNSNHYNTLLV